MAKLGLGTVQFGLPYGITNALSGKISQPTLDEVVKILHAALENGVETLDTASLYGNAEEVLGRALIQGHISKTAFKIVTKTPKFGSLTRQTSLDLLGASFEKSLKRLQVSSLYGLLFHDANDLLTSQGAQLINAARVFKEEKRLNKLGVSVYTAEQIDRILDSFEIDIIQIPMSMVDQRLLDSGHFQKLRDRKVEIHIRSILLQGVLLLSPEDLPPHFEALKPVIVRIRQESERLQISPLTLVLGFFQKVKGVSSVLVGTHTVKQLQETTTAWKWLEENKIKTDWDEFAIKTAEILNPSLWPKLNQP